MLKRSWLGLAMGLAVGAGMVALVALGLGASRRASSTGGLEVTLSTDKATYGPGETIRATLQVVNRSGEPVTLAFSTSQRFDLAIEDEGGEELWRWSAGRFFLQVLGEERLEPKGPALTYHPEAPAPDKPGSYRLLGGLAARGRALSASALFTVR